MHVTKTIFELSFPGQAHSAQTVDLPVAVQRDDAPLLPEVSELTAVRHYTTLSRKNFSIDTHFYPLGSCTMKYNPRGALKAAIQPGFTDRHPLAPESASQGVLQALYELQQILSEVTGMQATSLTPMAGAQGELAGVLMMRKYHEDRRDDERTEIIVPAAAHGTNPATATMCGYRAIEVAIGADGNVNLADLKRCLSNKTAGIMLTNPSTCAVFETEILQIADLVHDAGGLLYYDGANLNSILGRVRPGDMNFDVLHLNLHKTFATPHGGGGPGSGPVAVGTTLEPYLPIPSVIRQDDLYRYETIADRPKTIGQTFCIYG